MSTFTVGDLVQDKRDVRSLYIVVGCLSRDNGEKHYELIKIIPISKDSEYCTTQEKHLILHAENGSRERLLIFQFIKQELANRGDYEIPDFIKVLKHNSKNINKNIIDKEKTVDEKEVVISAKDDVVDNFRLKTTDDCLDAINHLDTLYNIFKDEEYIKYKRMAIKKIKKIESLK